MKTIKCFSYFLPSLLILLSLCSCARYRPQPLSPPWQKGEEKNNVHASKKVLTEDECRKHFDRRIIKRGYQPIQLHVKNNTNKTYLLDTYKISLPIEPIKNVTNKLHRDIIWKASKYFVIAGPVWGALEGMNSHNVNQKINTDFDERCIDENNIIKIKPYGTFNRVMFVAKDNTNYYNFHVILNDPENKEEIKFEL